MLAKRRTKHKSIIVLTFLLCYGIGVTWSQLTYAQSKDNQPNIIFILVDDQGYGDVGAFFQNQRAKEGKPHELSPNLDRMAAEGAILTQQYAAAPVCAPSRASLMLGVSQGHANVRDNQFDKAIADNYTMASALRTLGYSTAAIGKWGLQGDKRWDGAEGAKLPARPGKRGFDYFFGYMRHSDGHEHYPKEGLYSGKKEVWENGVDVASALDKCYTADLWTAATKHWIIEHKRGKDKDKPFFIYLAYDTPHAADELPTQKYPKGGGLHGGVQWIGIPGHFINTASGIPDSYINPEYANATYDDDNDPATPEVPWPDTYKRYAMANRRIDDGVGDIKQLLKDLHLDKNTLIVYTSDNGPSIETYLKKEKWEEQHLPTFFASYGPFDGIKRDNWEGGVRMPTIAWWPGKIPAGKVITHPSISFDWAPTFLNAAGQPAPERMDGVSLLPSLTGKGAQRKSSIYIEYFQAGKTPDFKEFAPNHRGRKRDQMQLLRIGDYVGVRYDIKSAKDSFEIYNVVEDPQETHNLMLQPGKELDINGHVRTVNQLQEYMQARVLQIRRPDSAAHRPYDSTLVPAVHANVVRGIRWKQYAGNFPWLPQIASLSPSAEGEGEFLQPLSSFHSGRAGVLLVEGFIKIPRDGNYTFYMTADTKAFLRLHDMQLIDEDYNYQGGNEKESSAFLAAGLHPFRLYYRMNGKTAPKVSVQWSGPQIAKQPIPEDGFFRNK